jgi:hypothetical protein
MTQVKKGDKVKIIGCKAGHGFEIGEVVTVVTVRTNSNQITAEDSKDNCRRWTVYTEDYTPYAMTEEQLLKEIKELELQIEEFKLRVQFIKENNLKEFNEDEFKVYHILKTVSSDKNDMTKAQEIVKLYYSKAA